ncbi:MAG: tetratricopeptide repeat protein [Nitrospirae bacterium]|nr:MAG: tetratricopeptide repeat protein [Nitrospirota bacterium]
MKKKDTTIAVFGIFIVAVVAYLPALENDFVSWDDHEYIYENPHITSLDIRFIKWAFGEFYAFNWHPVTWISHAIDYALWGLNPYGHHLTGIFIHSLNSVLVFLLGLKLLRCYRGMASEYILLTDNAIMTAAFVSGVLFGIHPIHVESVAWVSERKDLLCGLFFILSIIYYVSYADSCSGAKSACNPSWLSDRNYLKSFGFFVMAVFSKAMAVTLPALLLVIDWHPFNRFKKGETKRVFYEKIPFVLISFYLSFATIAAQPSLSVGNYPLMYRLFVGFNSMLAYIRNIFLPQNLSPMYLHPDDIDGVSFVPSFILASLVSAVLVWLAKEGRRTALAVWLCYIISLLPVIGIIKVGSQSMADRYVYLPGAALFFGFSFGAVFFAQRINHKLSKGSSAIFRAGLASSAIICILALAVLTKAQIGVWRDSISLWQRAVYVISKTDERKDYYRNSSLVYLFLGKAYKEQGRLQEAIEYFSETLRRNPRFIDVYIYLGEAFTLTGQLNEAARTYTDALNISTNAGNNVNLLTGLSNVYIKQQKFDEAIEAYRSLIKLKEDLVWPHFAIAGLLAKQGRLDDAIKEYRYIISRQNKYAVAHNNLGDLYERQKRFNEALNEFRIVFEVNPQFKGIREKIVRLEKLL